MLDRKNIHNSAMLKPDLAKHKHVFNELLPDGLHKCFECGKIKEKGQNNGSRHRQLHDNSSSSDIS